MAKQAQPILASYSGAHLAIAAVGLAYIPCPAGTLTKVSVGLSANVSADTTFTVYKQTGSGSFTSLTTITVLSGASSGDSGVISSAVSVYDSLRIDLTTITAGNVQSPIDFVVDYTATINADDADSLGGTAASGYALKSGATFTGDVIVPDEAYDATAWNGSLEVPTKNAVRDKIESLGSGVSDGDKGDITVSSSGAVWTIDTPTSATVATDDKVLIKDTSAADATRQVTAQSIADLSLTFKTIAVSGQSDVVADSATDTLTLAAGSNITITTNAGTDTVTIAATSGGNVATDAIFDAKGDLAVGTGADTAARLAVGTNGYFLKANSAEATGLEWAAISGGGDLLASNNLSDLANAATARTNLGLAIGTNVQAYDADLAVIAALADPNADRILFWDDSAGAYAFLTIGTNLSITGTTLDASGGGGGGASLGLISAIANGNVLY